MSRRSRGVQRKAYGIQRTKVQRTALRVQREKKEYYLVMVLIKDLNEG